MLRSTSHDLNNAVWTQTLLQVALVEGARQLGFEFRSRTRSHLTVSFQGHEVGGGCIDS